MKRVVLLLLCLPLLTVSAQEAKLPKDIEHRYDKFRDLDIWSTKLTDIPIRFSGTYAATGFSAAFIKEQGKPISLVQLIFLPEAVTIAGGFQQGAAGLRIESRSGKPHSGKPYFRPDAEVILLIGSERITLPKSEKSFPLAADGSYQGESFVTVPADVFCRLAESESWSMMIGDVIVGLGDKDVVSDKSEKVAKHWRSRVQPRLIELKKLIESHNAMVRN